MDFLFPFSSRFACYFLKVLEYFRLLYLIYDFCPYGVYCLLRCGSVFLFGPLRNTREFICGSWVIRMQIIMAFLERYGDFITGFFLFIFQSLRWICCHFDLIVFGLFVCLLCNKRVGYDFELRIRAKEIGSGSEIDQLLLQKLKHKRWWLKQHLLHATWLLLLIQNKRQPNWSKNLSRSCHIDLDQIKSFSSTSKLIERSTFFLIPNGICEAGLTDLSTNNEPSCGWSNHRRWELLSLH